MKVYAIDIEATASSGTWAVNTLNIAGGRLRNIFVRAASSDTTFDFKIIDEKDNAVYDTERAEKTATGVLDDSVLIVLKGKYTLQVYNSSADEDFVARLMVEE